MKRNTSQSTLFNFGLKKKNEKKMKMKLTIFMSNLQLLIQKFINEISNLQDIKELGLFYKTILPNYNAYDAEVQIWQYK